MEAEQAIVPIEYCRANLNPGRRSSIVVLALFSVQDTKVLVLVLESMMLCVCAYRYKKKYSTVVRTSSSTVVVPISLVAIRIYQHHWR